MDSFSMDIPSGQTELAEPLVQEVNDLLNTLALPIRINTPYDLTPSLLLAILESVLRERLPISTVTRESRTPTAKVETMKALLGVLENDVLKVDIGLSEIDPRRLAAGDWDEVVFVGQILCWVARARLKEEEYSAGVQFSGSSMSGGSQSRGDTSLDIGSLRLGYDASDTTATTLPSLDTMPLTPAANPHSSRRHAPRCIHELDFSQLSQGSLTDIAEDEKLDDFRECEDLGKGKEFSNPETLALPKIRRNCCSRQADDDGETFEAWRDHMRLQKGKATPKLTNAPSGSLRHNPTRHTSPSQYTAALLVERARLLEELARIK